MRTVRIGDENLHVVFKQNTGAMWSLWVYDRRAEKDVQFECGIALSDVIGAIKRYKAAGVAVKYVNE